MCVVARAGLEAGTGPLAETSMRGWRASAHPGTAGMQVLLILAAVTLASPVAAHHRQTDPVVALTSSGDTELPRVPAPGKKTLALAVQFGGGRRIVSISPWHDRSNPAAQTIVAEAGDHANPAVSYTGRAFAFDSGSDPLGTGLPGRQVIGARRVTLFAVSNDPSGTSINPSIDSNGNVIVFESTADLAGTGNPGARQVFARDRDGSIRQLSVGVGTSRNPVVSARRKQILFESSSDPVSGAETGVSQIWFGQLAGGPATPITAGLGPSRNPAISNDERLVVFESTADLAGTQADTGVPQVFLYHIKSKTYARITDEPAGCTLPSAAKVKRDYRIAYVCDGVPFFTMVRANERYRVPAPDGVTQRVIAELGIHFLILSTTSNLLQGSGTTPGNQVYLVNLFKRPAIAVAGDVTWFPSPGLSPL
jgi:hypothetical protein